MSTRNVVTVAAIGFAAMGLAAVEPRSAVRGLDHIPIAVNDLDGAAADYRQLGFTLKPGRPHANGIRNQHAKFRDGTELELITAPNARDALTTKYRRHLAAGDGPAFLALFAPDKSRAPAALDPPLDYLFFGGRQASPTDRAEHFAHANTAESLVGVWLAAEDLSRERALFERLGATISRREVHVPHPVTADVARFNDGEVVMLPGAYQHVAGRRIVGVTLRVRSLTTARESLAGQVLVAGAGTSSLFVAPATAHGLWLQFSEVKD